MANYIFKTGEIILRCSNGATELLHDYLTAIIAKEKIDVSKGINNFIEHLDQNIYGLGAIGIELDKHLSVKADRIMLNSLVEKVIKKLKNEGTLDGQIGDRVIGGLEGFRDKILD